MSAEKLLHRRSFLTGLAASGAALSLPTAAFAGTTHRLKMYNRHTEEHFNELVIENGRWNLGALQAFDWFARDWRENQSRVMDPNLVAILVRTRIMMDTKTPTVLSSGFRTPRTNSRLPGAVVRSYHIPGKALDIHQPDRTPRQMARAAMTARGGGVGTYSHKGFIHIDTGSVRNWGS